MEKNPISFLQEYMMAHKREIPNYVIIAQTVGTHKNIFHMRVQCNDHIAEGIGSSKKEAKTNAAVNMLKLLKLYTNQTPSDSSPNNSSYPANSNCQDVSVDSSSFGPNYIGILQELTAHNSSSPEYILKSITGPPHNPLFTYICKYKGNEEEASSKKKKEAKSLAAKKMLEKLSNEVQIDVSKENYQSYLDTMTTSIKNLELCEDNKTLMVKSASKALEYYPKVNKMSKSILTDNQSYDKYHTFLKNSLSNDERESAVNQLQETIEACQTSNKKIEKIINPIHILHAALKILNINLHKVTYSHNEGYNIYGLKLLTNPIISEIGYGIDKRTAENMAVYQIAKTLSIMLL